jgi:hypothetical protein
MAVGGASSGGATAAENATASEFAAGVAGTASGAFSLGQSAYNGRTVYFGTRAVGGAGGGEYETAGRRVTMQPVFMTPQEAYGDYFKWDPKQRKDLTAAGIVSGQLSEGAGDIETAVWWKSLVEQSARYGAAGQNVSPMDLASSYVSGSGLGLTDQQRFQIQRGSFPAGAIFDSSGKYTRTYRDGQFIVNEITGERSYVGPKFRTTTQTRTDLTDPNTVKALTTTLFQQLVGRDPGPGELGQFAQALQQAEKSSPVTETTQSEYDSLGNVVSQTSTSQGGLSAEGKQQLLADKLKQTGEYGVHQSATTYANALHQAIWGGP